MSLMLDDERSMVGNCYVIITCFILEPPLDVSDVGFLQDDARSKADNLSWITYTSCFSLL
jgi:hypothetical protein